MSKNKKYYPMLDLWKYICSILVLVIHTFPMSFNYWLDGATGIVTRFANPSFFTISGFLLFGRILQKTDESSHIVRKQIKRIFILYGLWSIFYIIILLPENISNGNIASVSYWTNSLLLKGVVHYFWFFPALMVGILITYFLFRLKISTKNIAVIGMFVLLIGCMISTYKTAFMGLSVFESVYESFIKYITAKNGIFFGFPYIAMGCYLSEKYKNSKTDKGKTKANRYFIGMCFFFVMLGCESLLVTKRLHPSETYLWIMVYPMIYCVISYFLESSLCSDNDFRLLGKISSFTYVFQYIPITLINLMFDRIGFYAWFRGIVLLICCVIVCNLVALMVIKLSVKINSLKYIY